MKGFDINLLGRSQIRYVSCGEEIFIFEPDIESRIPLWTHRLPPSDADSTVKVLTFPFHGGRSTGAPSVRVSAANASGVRNDTV